MILDRRAAVETVEVVFEEPLGGEPARIVRRRRLRGGVHHPLELLRLAGAVQVAGHQLQRGVAVRGAALVVDRHPAGQVGAVVGRVQHHHVVALPRDAAGQIRRLDPLRRRQLVLEQPDQGRLGHEVLRDRRQHQPAPVAEVDLAVDLEHRAVRRQERRLVERAVARVDPHLPADVLLHELGARHQVELVVLLEHPEPGGIRQRPQMHAGRVDERRDVRELRLAGSGCQPHLPNVLHEAEAAVVDGQHHVALVLLGDRDECRSAERYGSQRRDAEHQRRERSDERSFHWPVSLPGE